MAQNLANLLKDINLQIQDAHHTTAKMNTKEATLCYMRVKLASLESSKRKITCTPRNYDTISG